VPKVKKELKKTKKTSKKDNKKPVKKVTTSSASKANKAQTMDDLLKQTGYQFHGFKRGDIVEGIISEKNKRSVWVDIGSKTEGIILEKELKTARDFVKSLNIGDKVKVTVLQPENESGQPLLSFKKTLSNFVWSDFESKLKSGEPIRVRGKEVNRGGLVVDVKGLPGFIPTSCFSAKFTGRVNDLVNQTFEAKLIEVDQEKNRLILSEKQVSEPELIEEQQNLLKEIKKGQIFDGEVTGVMPFGLFVKIQIEGDKNDKKAKKIDLEGLVHISEISWEKVEDPSKFYKPKDKVKVKVLTLDKKSNKLNFSIKQLKDDPWQEIEKSYPIDKKVKGEVTRVAPFGIFVNLDKGVEGLIHISRVPAEKSIKEGDKLDCFVESIDIGNRKMSLGLVLKAKPVGYK